MGRWLGDRGTVRRVRAKHVGAWKGTWQGMAWCQSMIQLPQSLTFMKPLHTLEPVLMMFRHPHATEKSFTSRLRKVRCACTGSRRKVRLGILAWVLDFQFTAVLEARSRGPVRPSSLHETLQRIRLGISTPVGSNAGLLKAFSKTTVTLALGGQLLLLYLRGNVASRIRNVVTGNMSTGLRQTAAKDSHTL
jgi:hypothetical protein